MILCYECAERYKKDKRFIVTVADISEKLPRNSVCQCCMTAIATTVLNVRENPREW